MNSRIDTLFKTFKLETRKLNNVVTNNQLFEVDYSNIESILKAERDRTIKYLKDALNVKCNIYSEN